MVHRRHGRFGALAAAIAAVVIAGAQSRGNPTEWPTAYGDGQRTSWIRNDVSISLETMSQPGFELQWKTTLESPVRHGVSLGTGVITSGVNIFTPLSTIAAPSNQVFAIDNDTGNLFWTRRFEGALAAGTAECPGGISGSLTRMVSLTTPDPAPSRGGGRGRGGYSSAVGEPGAGVPIPNRAGGARGAPAPATTPASEAAAPSPARAPSPAAPAASTASSTIPPGQWRTSPFPTNAAAQGSWTGLFRPSGVVYAVSADGMFRTLGVVSGKDLQRPAPFLPAGARFSDLIAVGDRLYTSTSQGCGGAADGVWAINISGDTKSVISWKTNGGRPLGSVAFTTTGTLIVAVGSGTVTAQGYANAVVALDPKTLAVKDWYKQPGVEIVAPPVIFQESGKDIVAVSTKDGRILLLDAASLGGASHATPLFASASLTGGATTFAAQSPAMWQERSVLSGAATPPVSSSRAQPLEGGRWLLIPLAGALPASLGVAGNGAVSSGGLLGVKLVHQDGKFSVQPAWVSQNIPAPLTPIVVNGVPFVASGPSNAPAGLYALHGATGKTLWQSDKTITGPLSGRSFWVGSGHVFMGTRDGTVYAFGFAMERK
jgi:PQQ-like domain